MKRIILRYRGPADKPEGALDIIRSAPGLTILDESPRMVLVEMPEAETASLAAKLPEWTLSEESIRGFPEPKPDLRLKRRVRRDGQ